MNPEQIHSIVRDRYTRAARGAGCGCADPGRLGYGAETLEEVPEELKEASLGCGNPLSHANLSPGERVLDLGSGAGLDVTLASRAVGPGGLVYGVDFTPEMLERARRHLDQQKITNVTLLEGRIEKLPLPEQSVDVVISNCVINLSPDKPAVFREAFRVLAPGGRLVVSDILATAPIPENVREDAGAWAECIAGAIPENEYLEAIRAAGFHDLRVIRGGSFELPGSGEFEAAAETASGGCCGAEGCCSETKVALVSAIVLAKRPR